MGASASLWRMGSVPVSAGISANFRFKRMWDSGRSYLARLGDREHGGSLSIETLFG